MTKIMLLFRLIKGVPYEGARVSKLEAIGASMVWIVTNYPFLLFEET
jgi:hypothetical protein